LRHGRLRHVATVERSIAARTIRKYTVDLYAKGRARITTAPNPDAGLARRFEVFEPIRS
jgi:hypothetical protein